LPFPNLPGQQESRGKAALGFRFTSNRAAPLILALIHTGTNRRSVKLSLPRRIHGCRLPLRDIG
jgi:hypothetical protein